jgi:PAS domain S-box-containing protein
MTNKMLLLVEDSPTQSFRLKIMLEEYNFDVIQANSGREAYKLAIERKPDVILSDILMPEMDGFELCHSIQNNEDICEIPIILQSANYQSKEDRDFGLDIGADAFIPKGIPGEELSRLIHQVLKDNKKKKRKDASSKDIVNEPFDILHAQRMLYRLLEETALLEQANSAIKAERNRAQQLLDVASVMMVAIDVNGLVMMINPKGCKILGYELDNIIGEDWFTNFVADPNKPEIKNHYIEMLHFQSEPDHYVEYLIRNKAGEERLIAWHSTLITNEAGHATGILSSGEDITEKKIAEQKIFESEEKYHSLFNNIPDGVFQIGEGGYFLTANPAIIQILGYQSEEELRKVNFLDLLSSPEQKANCIEFIQGCKDFLDLELELKNKAGKTIFLLINAKYVQDLDGNFRYYEGTLTDITNIKLYESELAELYQQEQRRVKHLGALQKISNELVGIHSQKRVVEVAAEQGRLFADHSACAILKVIDEDKKQVRIVAKSGFNKLFPEIEGHNIKISPIEEVFEKRKPVFINRKDLNVPKLLKINLDWEIHSINAYPILINEKVNSIMVFGRRSEEEPPEWEVALIELLTERVAIALENAQLFEEINQSFERLASLRSIDQAISSNQNLDNTIDILLNQVLKQLAVSAVCIMLCEKSKDVLIYKWGKGPETKNIYGKKFYVDKSMGGQAVIEKHTIFFPRIDINLYPYLQNEKFLSAVATPILIKGEIKGVLEVFKMDSDSPSLDWLEFFETLARQAAIALDNYELFTNLQKTNVDLSEAYDATIQGWSRAMDLRDKETEGHTQRVTEMTINMAVKMNYPQEKLIHLRRGALLHDIGKMGIPDRILLKEGPLNDEEWEIMRKHPEFAYELLAPIEYLWPALEIPYCHHEKWDGSGYPRGLKGEEIPLAARIFSIVDVWDALTSDRPYRKAWPAKQTFAHIRDQRGKHFDPYVTDLFLKFYAKE